MNLFKKSRLEPVYVRPVSAAGSGLQLVWVDPRQVDAVTMTVDSAGCDTTHIFRKGCDTPFSVPGHASKYRRLLGV